MMLIKNIVDKVQKKKNEEDEDLTEDEIAEKKYQEQQRLKKLKEKERRLKEKERKILQEKKEAEKAEKEARKPKRKVIIDHWDLHKSVMKVEEWKSTREGYMNLGFYLFFVVLYIIVVTMQMQIGNQSKLGEGIQSVFNNITGFDNDRNTNIRYLSGLSQQSDFWNFLINNVLVSLFVDQWYNGDPYASDETGFLLNYNKVVGGLLVVQTKGEVLPDGCESLYGPTSYKQFYKDCYTLNPITTNGSVNDPDVGSAFNYSSQQEGYSYFFGVAAGLNKTLQNANQLMSLRWTDKSTRTIALKFAIYNGNINSFAFVSILFVYGITGVFVSGNNISYQAIVMEPYRGKEDMIRLGLEIVFMILVSNQICNFFHELYTGLNRPGGLKKILNIWTLVDAANLGLLGVFVFLRVWILWIMTENFIVVPTNKYEPILEQIAAIQNFQKVGTFLNIFLAIIRLFQFYSFQERLDVLNKTFQEAMVDLYHFMMMFGVIFGGFGIMGHFLFGLTLMDYSSVGRSLQTLWQMMLGQFSFDQIESTNATMASVFFICFMFLVQMVLLNVLLAILIDAYTQANNASAESVFAELGMGVMRMFLAARRSGLDQKGVLSALKRLQKRQMDRATTDDILAALPHPMRIPKMMKYWPDLRRAEKTNPQDEFEAKIGPRVKKENLIDQLDAVIQENAYMFRRVRMDPEVKLPAFKSVPAAQ